MTVNCLAKHNRFGIHRLCDNESTEKRTEIYVIRYPYFILECQGQVHFCLKSVETQSVNNNAITNRTQEKLKTFTENLFGCGMRIVKNVNP